LKIDEAGEEPILATTFTDATRFKILKDSRIVPLISILVANDTVVLIYHDGTVATNTFTTTRTGSFTCSVDKSVNTDRQKTISILISSDQIRLLSNCFRLMLDGKMLLSCGDWDASFSLTVIQSSTYLKLYRKFYDHYFTVSCMATDDTFLATGSNDGCVMIWQISQTPPASGKGLTPIHRLQGHTGAITCVDIYADEDTIVSGSEDGTCRLYSLAKAKFTRRLRYDGHIPEKVQVTEQAHIVTLCSSFYLSVHSMNGKLLGTQESDQKIYDFQSTTDGEFLITGDAAGQVTIMELYSLRILKIFELSSMVRSIGLSKDNRYIFAGLENGELFIIPFSPTEE